MNASSDLQAVRSKVAARFGTTLGDADVGRKLEIVLWNAVLNACSNDGVPLTWGEGCVRGGLLRRRYTSRAVGMDVYNLRRNASLRRRLVEGELPLKRYVGMAPWEVNPEIWAATFERVAFKQLRKQLTVDVDSAPDGAFQCSRCRSRKTTFYQMQTRSADEPMTCFISCLACSKRWKQ